MLRPLNLVIAVSSRILVSSPSMNSRPLVGRSSRPTMLSSVLLPEPDGPIRATNSPRRKVRSISCKTSTSTAVPTLYDLHTFSSLRTSPLLSTDRHHRIELSGPQRWGGGGSNASKRRQQDRVDKKRGLQNKWKQLTAV